MLSAVGIFVFIVNWLSALVPFRPIEITGRELVVFINDINSKSVLVFITSAVYFYRGFDIKSLIYFKRYAISSRMLLPINILEDFTKLLSLSFRLFGNILADELVVGVTVSLIPVFIPTPLMLLGLFTSAIQALIFSIFIGVCAGESIE